MPRCFGNRFCAVVVFAGPVAASFGQPIPSSRQSPPVAETSSQNATPSQEKQAAVAEAARKAKETKAAAAKGKVFTEDDLAGLRGGVSVVGTENNKQDQPKPSKPEDAEDAQNGEAYWRGKPEPILQEEDEIERLGAQLGEDAKEYSTAGNDTHHGRQARAVSVQTH